jgi:hypothetical protein
MATLTVSSGDYIRPASSTGEIRHYGEGASQTFKKGDPVIFGSDADEEDLIKVAGADPAAIIGFAAEDASGTKGTKIAVYCGDTEFLVRVADTQTLDVNMLKAAGFGIVADATNTIWRLDTGETTAKIFKVRRLVDAHGDVNGRVIALFLRAERENEL